MMLSALYYALPRPRCPGPARHPALASRRRPEPEKTQATVSDGDTAAPEMSPNQPTRHYMALHRRRTVPLSYEPLIPDGYGILPLPPTL
eukprot:scaffold3497_cov153-Isochrysis_galbana.AAC.1